MAEYIATKEASELLGINVKNLLNGSYAGTKMTPKRVKKKDRYGHCNFYKIDDVLDLVKEREQRQLDIAARKLAKKEASLRRRGLLSDEEELDDEGNTRLVSGYRIEQVGRRAKVYHDDELVATCASYDEARDYLTLQRGKPAPRALF